MNSDLYSVRRFGIIFLFFVITPAPLFAQGSESVHNSDAESQTLFHLGSNFSSDCLKILSWSDTLKNRISSKFCIDSIQYQTKIDSLQNLNLSTEKYRNKLDSITQRKDRLLTEVQQKKNQLLSESKSKLEEWNRQVQKKRAALTSEVPSANLPENITDVSDNIPDVNMNIPYLHLPDLRTPGLDNIDLPEIPSMPSTDLANLDLSPDLSAINKSISFDGLDQLNGVTEKIGSVKDDISALGSIQENPDKAIETAMSKVTEFDGVKNQLEGLEAVKKNEFVEAAENLKDPEALQQQAKEMVVEKAVDHFAGKEAVLQQAMNQIAKLKQKYSSVNSLSEIGKRPPNPMKGKPFVERILPGVGLQFLRNENLLLDLNPYAAYLISGRLSAGLGWNQRIGYSLKHNYFTSAAVVYGPRIFAEVRAWRGYILRAEAETMNTTLPSTFRPIQTDITHREWVETVFLGFKKEYRFMKGIRGTAFMMFSVYNDHRKSPYGDVINSRFGFEFPLKKKAVPPTQ
jgi:hypothetical protein